MAEHGTAIQDAVEQVLRSDEVVRWQETSRTYSWLPLVVGVLVVLLGTMVTVLLLFAVGDPVVLVIGGFLLWCPVGYVLYRRLRGPRGPYAYVATDRRMLVVPASEPAETRSIAWDEVGSMTVTTDGKGSKRGIAIQTGDEDRDPRIWGPLSSGVLITFPPDATATFHRLLDIRREHDSFDPASVDPTRVGWSTSRQDLGDPLATELASSETVLWHARAEPRGFHAIAVLASVFVAVHVYAGSWVLATDVFSLSATLADVGPLLPAAGSVWAVRVAQRRFEDVEYGATDQRLLRTAGLRGDVEGVRWTEVSGVERSGNGIAVSTPDDSETLRIQRIPDLDEACRYLQYIRRRRT